MLRLGSNKIFSPYSVKVLRQIKIMNITISYSVENILASFIPAKWNIEEFMRKSCC